MNITIQYQPTAQELAKASSLFIEKKPFFLFSIGFINIVALLLLTIMLLKLFLLGLTPNEWLAAFGATLWLFVRKPFNEWLLLQKMKRSLILKNELVVDISRNGIIWSGKGLLPGNLSWNNVKYVMEAQNGFVFPNNLTQFLWLPFRGFASLEAIEELKQLLKEHNINLRTFKKWRC